MGGIGAAVPHQPAARPIVDELVGLVLAVEEMLGELRHRLKIFQRRHRPEPRLPKILAALLDGKGVRRREGVARIVAGGAGHPPGAGKGRIEEQVAPKRAQLGRLSASLHPRHRRGHGTTHDGAAMDTVRACRKRRAETNAGEGSSLCLDAWVSSPIGRPRRGGPCFLRMQLRDIQRQAS